MRLSEQNTQFFTFFTGVNNEELVALERLGASFHEYFPDFPLFVMDQHGSVQTMIQNGERIYYTDNSYVENISSSLDLARLEEFFSRSSDFVRRVEVERQYPHGPFINETVYNHRTLPYAVIMDSDVWIKNPNFLNDLNNLIKDYSEEEIVAAGHIRLSMPFELPSEYPRTSKMHLLHRVGNYLTRRYGAREARGKLPELDPTFLWINGDLFTRLNMSFQNMRLNILDTTLYNGSNYKLLGDNGASVLFQAALARKSVINIDVRKYRGHAESTATRVGRQDTYVDWFSIANFEWPPSGEIRKSEIMIAATKRSLPSRALGRFKRLLRPS